MSNAHTVLIHRGEQPAAEGVEGVLATELLSTHNTVVARHVLGRFPAHLTRLVHVALIDTMLHYRTQLVLTEHSVLRCLKSVHCEMCHVYRTSKLTSKS